MKGKIYLVPVTLGNDDCDYVIPVKVLEITRNLRFFVVEDIRSARRYLRQIDKGFPINEAVFTELSEHTRDEEVSEFLRPVINGNDLGIMSEAGLPGIADPGSRLINLAHKKNIRIIPLSGPSSIILALISSGLNGQNFTFNGYLPVKAAEKSAKIRNIEKKAREGYTQIFMEAPYRNNKLLESLLSICQNETQLCIAVDISLPGESIRTMRISEWKKNIPDIDNHLVVFIIQ